MYVFVFVHGCVVCVEYSRAQRNIQNFVEKCDAMRSVLYAKHAKMLSWNYAGMKIHFKKTSG